MSNNLIIFIMAAGLGKRMNNPLPKVLVEFNNKPMLCHVLDNSIALKPENIFIIVGKHKDLIKSVVNDYFPNNNFEYVVQEDPKGTGHAIQEAIKYTKDRSYNNYKVLILSGDVPLLRKETLIEFVNSSRSSIICAKLNDPKGMGRIVGIDLITKIIEEKDANDEEKKINIINGGIYLFLYDELSKHIFKLNNDNMQNEYYLVDVVKYINTYRFNISNASEIFNINTINDLENAKKLTN